MSWVPTTDFEEEIVDLQPDHNFIFGRLCDNRPQEFYPRPKAHLDFVAQQKNEKSKRGKDLTNSQNHKLNLIAKVQRIAGTKPLGEQPTIDDWNDNKNLERETIALMRHVGLGPNLEQPLNEACTVATHPITDKVKINRNGRKQMPIFFDEEFFTLKPRISASPSSSRNNSPIFDGLISPDESCVSHSSSSIATSMDNFEGHSSSASPNSGFETATDIVGNEDSFQTASSNGNRSTTRNWRKTKSHKETQSWRNVDNKIESLSWRNFNTKSQNRNSVGNQIQNNCNWLATKSVDHKEKAIDIRKKDSQLYTPKELYEKKRIIN